MKSVIITSVYSIFGHPTVIIAMWHGCCHYSRLHEQSPGTTFCGARSKPLLLNPPTHAHGYPYPEAQVAPSGINNYQPNESNFCTVTNIRENPNNHTSLAPNKSMTSLGNVMKCEQTGNRGI